MMRKTALPPSCASKTPSLPRAYHGEMLTTLKQTDRLYRWCRWQALRQHPPSTQHLQLTDPPRYRPAGALWNGKEQASAIRCEREGRSPDVRFRGLVACVGHLLTWKKVCGVLGYWTCRRSYSSCLWWWNPPCWSSCVWQHVS